MSAPVTNADAPVSAPSEQAGRPRTSTLSSRDATGRRRFDELIGQEHVAQALSNAITSHRVGHAYLFTGAREAWARPRPLESWPRRSIACMAPPRSPCNECDICKSISTGEDVDVLEIDGASNRGIDEIRQLRQNANVRPSRARGSRSTLSTKFTCSPARPSTPC